MLAISLNPIDWVTSAGGAIASGAAGAVFDGAANWVQDGMREVAGKVAEFFVDLSESNLGDETFEQLGGLFKWIALATVVLTMILGSSGSLLGIHKLGDVIQEVPVTLLMLAGWYGAVALWAELTNELTRILLDDALIASLENMGLEDSASSFLVMIVALVLMIFLLIFMVEMLVLSHAFALAAVLGPLSIALRPWPSLKAVSGRMVRNLATLSLTPPLTVVSLSIALRTLNDQGQLSFFGAMGAIAGLAVSVLMPSLINRFLPLDGQGGLGARGMLAAGVGAAAAVTAVVATGGAAAAAAPGAIGAVSNAGDGDG